MTGTRTGPDHLLGLDERDAGVARDVLADPGPPTVVTALVRRDGVHRDDDAPWPLGGVTT